MVESAGLFKIEPKVICHIDTVSHSHKTFRKPLSIQILKFTAPENHQATSMTSVKKEMSRGFFWCWYYQSKYIFFAISGVLISLRIFL